MLKTLGIALEFCFLVALLAGCSRSSFPVGSWKESQQNFMASATNVVLLRPDHTGSIDVQVQALLDSENHHADLRWSYSAGTLRFLSDGNPEIDLVLVAKTDSSATWRRPDGSLVDWQKVGDGTTQ